MRRPEEIDQFGIADDVWIVDHFNHLGVGGLAACDLLIGGLGFCAARVATDCVVHAIEMFVKRFHAPEAARAEHGRLHVLWDFDRGRSMLVLDRVLHRAGCE